MTNKIILNNSIRGRHSAKPRSPTINTIQPLSLSSPPILTKQVYYTSTNFPTNIPKQVYTTIPTSISPNHDIYNSKLANEIRKIPNLINKKIFFVLTLVILQYSLRLKPILQKKRPR